MLWSMRLGLLAAAALLWTGCTIDDVDLSDKPCPCAGGYQCVADRCVPEGASVDAGDADGGATDGGPTTDAGGEPGAFEVTNLRSDWTTPNVIHWRWDRSGEASDFGELRLVVAESMEDVLAESGTAVVFDSSVNPELGVYLLLRTGTPDPVVQTLTDGHEPATRYHARLTALDSAGRRRVSNVATATTAPAPIDELVLFSDDAPPGYPLPDTIDRVTDAPFAGTHHLRYEHASCPSGADACWEAVRWQRMNLDPPAFSEGTFATTAYLELALAHDSPTPPYWTELWMFLGSEGDYTGWLFAPFTARNDDAYQVIQVPLRVLETSAGVPLTYADTRNPVDQFRVGGLWEVGTTVRVDEVRIRW